MDKKAVSGAMVSRALRRRYEGTRTLTFAPDMPKGEIGLSHPARGTIKSTITGAQKDMPKGTAQKLRSGELEHTKGLTGKWETRATKKTGSVALAGFMHEIKLSAGEDE